MRNYRLTVRHGSEVDRRRFGSLDDALAELRTRAEEIRGEGGRGAVKMIRTYEPEQQVAARLEISTGGFLRRRDVGIDVMGDGRLVPYRGGVARRELATRDDGSPYEALREALAG